MAHATIARYVVFDVAAHAPTHPQRRDLRHLSHLLDVAVTSRACLRAERLDMPHVREAHEARQGVDPNPFRRFSPAPSIPPLLALRLMRRRAPADQLMATDARLQRRDPRLARDGRRIMKVHAVDLVMACMNVV